MLAKLSNFFYRHDLAVCLVWLSLLSFLVFGNITRNSGFYLDDWSMLKLFYFGPQDFFGMAENYLREWPLIAPRPVQAPFHAALYMFFGMAPFGYHLTAAVLDVIAFVIFYLIVRDLFGNKVLAILAASLALIDPRHDTNHNWVLCISVALSQMLTLLSLYMAMEGARRKSLALKLLSVVPFAIMTFNYELFLPAAVLNAVVLARKEKEGSGFLKTFSIKRFLLWGIYFALPVVLLLVFQKVLLPRVFGIVPTIHQVIIDPVEIFSTIFDGILIQISPLSFANLGSYIALNASELYNRTHLFLLSIIVAVSSAIILAFNTAFNTADNRAESATGRFDHKQLLTVVLCGLVTTALAYSLFGLNREYHPAVATIYNRVNTGGSWGGALIIAALALWLSGLAHRKRVVSDAFLVTLSGALIVFYTSVDWCFDKPWIASWTTQKNVQSVLREQVGTLAPANSVLLLNCPRYVNWSPVFDGVWDFERMVQITSKDKSMKGTVISDRLELTPTQVSDIAHSYVAGVYPFATTYLLQPDRRTLTKVTSPLQFIDTVERDGMKFGLPPAAVAKWRNQLKKAQ